MKVYNIRDFYESEYQEYIIGYKATGCRSAYLVSGGLTYWRVCAAFSSACALSVSAIRHFQTAFN